MINNLFGDWALKFRAHPQVQSALISDQAIQVNNAPWISFYPHSTTADTALVLYPGALTDPKAYAPIMRQISEQGFVTIIAPMPSNMAILAPTELLDIKAAHPQIKVWALAGHSIGGGAALLLLKQHPDAIDGLMMWDSYTFSGSPATHLTLPITTLYGTSHHNPKRPQKFADAKVFMPEHVNYIAIEGGDHFQFGHFNQEDIKAVNTATISYQQQQQQIIEQSVIFLRSLHTP
ncbi:hypothetical protein BST96_08495 [Oceanicoccus sagamiensis]|uniref:Alpha/beta hydrolase fold-5 domain-containing protein n=2 Tax=Oceanicoccus sagamiensis TaxID=716816 RepID=A0A1X9NE35_9GAMM|nr:hypothetical protein BST96_08495 [Oceanicoccus sagamiensis]